jgi:hypothetical protein
MRRRGPRSVQDEGSRIDVFRGSITRLRHWLSTLRRPGYPDTTQDSLPAVGQTLPDGLDYPQGSIERFRVVSYISASFPKLNVAQGQAPFSAAAVDDHPAPKMPKTPASPLPQGAQKRVCTRKRAFFGLGFSLQTGHNHVILLLWFSISLATLNQEP